MPNHSEKLLLCAALCCELGGTGNIRSVTHCATRLRLQIRNGALTDLEKIKAHSEVLDAFFQGTELQIICSLDPSELLPLIQQLQGSEEQIKKPWQPQASARSGNRLFTLAASLTRLLASVIMPLIGFLAAGGILNALMVFLLSCGLLTADDALWRFFQILLGSLMNFLPVMLGYTCARHFKTNALTGIALGLCLIPEFEIALAQAMNGGAQLFAPFLQFLQEQVGSRFNYSTYAVSILPIITASAVNVYLERWCRRIFPHSLQYIAVPLVSLGLCVPLIILLLAPLFTVISYLSSDLILNLYDISPAAVGLILGFFWEILVSFGMHWILTPAMFNNLTLLGYEVLMPLVMLPVFAVTGAATGFYASCPAEERPTLKNAVTMALLGITEPALYGFLLRRRRIFLSACAVAAVSTAVFALFHPKFYSSALQGLLAFPVAVSAEEGLTLILPVMIAFSFGTAGLCCALSYLLNRRSAGGSARAAGNGAADTGSPPGEGICAPCAGQYVPLSAIPDPIFSSGMLGPGCALQPEEDLLRAPCSGRLSADITFAHAVGIETKGGAQLLLHAGINTVRLQGQSFELLARPGQEIKAGDPLLRMDRAAVTAAGLNPCVILLAVDSGGAEAREDTQLQEGSAVSAGRVLFRLEPKQEQSA